MSCTDGEKKLTQVTPNTTPDINRIVIVVNPSTGEIERLTIAEFFTNLGLTVEQNGTFTIDNKFSLGSQTEKTISAGEITIDKSYHTIDTEANAASDDLDTINGGVEGDILFITSQSSSRDVVLKNGTGNLILGSDYTLTSINDMAQLILKGGSWKLVSFSNNA